MTEIIGIRFKDVGKIFYFTSKDQFLNINDLVIVETSKGLECGKVVIKKRHLSKNDISNKIRPILRKADKKDIDRFNKLKAKEKKAFNICKEKIKKHNLDMKLINVEYTFDGKKILFYFTAEKRIDFRKLVKELASIFKTRIELRQIGVRDESKFIGGMGTCGKPFCCSTFLDEFQPVSIKMAKEQGLSLNPVKISGTCGRLMCCLKYEHEAYTDLLKHAPKIGALVETPKGTGTVIEQNLLTGSLKVRMDSSYSQAAPMYFNLDEVKIIKDAKIKVEKEELDKLKNLE